MGWSVIGLISLMTAACAKAYGALRDKKYLQMAERAALFIKTTLTDPSGRLYVRYRDGQSAGRGFLDDYAFTAYAMLALYDATYDVGYLEDALEYAEKMCTLFEDRGQGGYFLTAEDSERLAYRPKETYDGAMPSGNSVAGYVLIRLARLTAEDKWEARAMRQLEFLASDVKAYPSAHCFALMAAMYELYPTKEVVITARDEGDAGALGERLAARFIPNLSLLYKTNGNADRLARAAPFIKDYVIAGDKTNIYICENKACSVPFTDLDELIPRLTGGALNRR
jgi:uncharacterized protein YyaL (SSP411 family)